MPVNIVYYVYLGDVADTTLRQLEVSIGSLAVNREFSKEYAVTVYTTTGARQKILDRISFHNSSMFRVQVEELNIPKINDRSEILASKLFAFDAACRSFLRFIYLDTDTIIHGDISELFEENLFGYDIGGVEDSPLVVLRKIKPAGYINSGVLLVDSKRVVDKFPNGMSALFDRVSKMRFHDQDFINDNLSHALLNSRYNVIGWCYEDFVHVENTHTVSIFHYAGSYYTGYSDIKNKIGEEVWNTYSDVVAKKCSDSNKKTGRILLARKHRAFGDWIIFADVLKAINDTYPDIQVDVEANGNARTDILTECGCRYRLVANPRIEDYDGYDPHVLYNTNPVTPNKHIIVSALENTCTKIPILNIKDFVLINLVSPVVLPEDYKVPDGEYVIVPHYYPPLVSSRVKDYSQENYNRLVSLLSSQGYKVFELNSGSVEYRYSTNDKSYSDSTGVITTKQLGETAKLLKHAKFCVLIENGMNHWACHNGARSYCIFKSPIHARPDSLRYSTMIPIECYNNESPEYVFSEIMKQEKR